MLADEMLADAKWKNALAIGSIGKQKCYLANLPAEIGLRGLAATVKARLICEQAHQQFQRGIGLDHFEG